MKKFFIALLTLIIVLIAMSYKTKASIILNPTWENYNVKVIRDSLGVPHIVGKTDADAAYGLAYAHMEDDSKTILDVIHSSKGRLASFYGKDLASSDYFYHLLNVKEIVDREYLKQLDAKTRALLEAYAEGINTYLYKHPSDKGSNVFPVEGKDIVAGFLMKTPLFFGLDRTIMDLFTKNSIELDDYIVKTGFGHLSTDIVGSNVIALNKNATRDGSTRLFINSHQPWDGPVAWYEAHVMSDEGQNIIGGLFPGSPVVLQGHNEHLGWGHTVNKPKLVEVYKLTLNPDNPDQYLIDGEWVDFEIKDALIDVKLFWNFHWEFSEKSYSSIYGPVIKKEEIAYAIQYVNRQNINTVEQWYKMGKSNSIKTYFNELKVISLPMFNIGLADKSSNIAYVYNAKFPKRFNKLSRKITHADNSNLVWKNYYDFENLPQLINPESGVVFNANNSPFNSINNEQLDPKYYQEIFNVIEKKTTNRSLRFQELFTKEKYSRQELIDIKYDLYYSVASNINKLRIKLLKHEFDNDSSLSVYKHIEAWNLRTDIENVNTASALLTLWPMRDDTNPSKEDFDSKMKEVYHFLHSKHNKINVKWGDINRIKRGSLNLPLNGGPDIIRAIYGKIENGMLYGTTGDSHIMLVEWDKGGKLSSYSRHQYGAASTNSESKHYNDQAKGFAQNRLKRNIIDKNYWKTTKKYKSYHPYLGEIND